MGYLEVEEFEERLYFSLREYRRLKDNFMDFLRYVPLVKEHFKVYSPKLSSLITDTCEQILDCLEVWIRAPIMRLPKKLSSGWDYDVKFIQFDIEREKFVEDMIKKKETHRSMSYRRLLGFIKKHKEFYETLANLEGNNIFIIPLQEFIQPFKPINGQIPFWWSVYNSLKHDKYVASKSGNLETSLHCLGALYRLVTYPHNPDSLPPLFAMGTISKK